VDAPARSESAHGFFAFITGRPVAVTMAFVTLLAFGWQSLDRLPVSLMPDISYPTVTVRAEYPGAAPEDVEERVTKRLHESLAVLPRLQSISSVSRAGLVDVTLEFSWGTPLTYAIQDIRERLDRTLLPLEVESPIILRYDPTLDPVLVLGLTGGRDLVELRRLAEDRLTPALSTIEGVAAVRVRGGLQDEIQVRLLPDRLATFGLRPADIAGRLTAENVNLASGTLLEGDTQYLVRILNEYRTPEEIAHTIVRRDGEGLVRLSDVATVLRTTRERDVITRIDAGESVELQVFKEADANIVELATRLRRQLFGTAEQRAWVAGLRAGTTPDPDEQLAAFRARVEADPRLKAAMDRVGAAGARAQDEEERHGGGPPGEGEAPEPPPDTRTEEQRLLDAELSAELDTIQSARRTKLDSFAYLAADLPSDVTVHLLSDQSRFIEAAIREVRDAAWQGALLAVLILYLFLQRLGPTLVISACIPISVICTFVPLYMTGTSLNVMSLGGLALGIGNLVDNAIVVLEAIARRRDEGAGRLQAAVRGTREVAMAVTASTLTTVAVFAPIAFVQGIAGQVFRDQALTVVVSQVASLIVALTLVPMLAARGGEGRLDLRRTARESWASVRQPLAALQRGTAGRARFVLGLPLRLVLLLVEGVGRVLTLAIAAALALLSLLVAAGAGLMTAVMWLPNLLFRKGWEAVERAYPPFLASVVGSPATRRLALLVAAAMVAWSLWAVRGLGSETLPEVHQGELIARLSLPVGSPLEATDAIVLLAGEALTGHPDVEWVSATAGVPRDEISQPDEGEHSARLSIGLRRSDDLVAAEERVMAALRARLAGVPELREPPRFERPTLFSVRAPIVVEIKGENLDELAAAAHAVEAQMAGLPGLRDVRTSIQPGNPEVLLSFDRDLLSRRGLDTREVATAVANMVQGTVATRFTDAEQRLDVLVQVDKASLASLEQLLALPANPADANPEPLSALADMQVREGPREIRRIWGQRAALVSAQLEGFDIGRTTARIRERVTAVERQGDLTIDMGGQGREMEAALSQMTQALLLAVFLVYVVMASLFESLLQPLIIMLTMPLAFVGAVLALWALDIPLSVIVFLGAIILAGIVVNNAIVLIDAINQRRRERGLPLLAATVEACGVRLRPVLMTTVTTVLGLLPMSGWLPFIGSEGNELRRPMAVTVIAGLSVSTLLTLVVIPVLYVMLESMLERRRAAQAAADGEAAPEPAAG
jgi:HAE1 family hydrophobic/amphiphilic exporter-1